MDDVKRSDPADAFVICPSCEVRNLCFGEGADQCAMKQLDAAVTQRIRLAAGEYLYHIGDPFKGLYAVRSGCLKNSLRDERGRDHVAGFHIMGDVVGVAGIEPHAYIFDMQALEPSEVCVLPLERLEELSAKVPALRRNIVRIFGRYRNRDARTQFLRRKSGADARVAGFVLEFSRRLDARGLDTQDFRLPMSRADIGNHLGLSEDAVGKAFARLRARRIAEIDRRIVKITDPAALEACAAGAALRRDAEASSEIRHPRP